MNLELVPCMFKSRAGDGTESDVVGLLIRAPGSTTGTIVPTTSTPPVISKPATTVTKQQKLQPKRADCAIAPKRVESLPPKILPAGVPSILPAPLTTSLSSAAITSMANGTLGIGSYINLPALKPNVPTPATSIKPPPKPRSKSRAKPKEKPTERSTSSSVSQLPNLPAPSFEMQSPPQLLPETNGNFSHSASTTVVSSSPPSYLPPISSIAPTTNGSPSSQHAAQQHLINSNGCTSDDLNAIEIAHSLSTDQMARSGYWHPHSSPQDQYFNHVPAYMYPPHSEANYPPAYPQTSDYIGHEHANGCFPSNGVYANQPQNGSTNGNHSNNGSWVPQPRPIQQQQYSGAQNQMTSSTPDSGIQSIDGSPPSSSAFTPPMVSPYPLQANHFDSNLTQQTLAMGPQLPTTSTQYSAGPMGALRPRLSNECPQQSHIQLPPLNCSMPSQASMPPPPSNSDKSYLDQQQPSCSYQTVSPNGDIDDIRIDPLHSVSPPALDGEKQQKDSDSDCDYSDMPTLIRADHSKNANKAVNVAPEVRAPSRVSEPPEEEKKVEEAKGDVISINPNMDEKSLLHAVKTSFNIYLASKNQANPSTAKGIPTQAEKNDSVLDGKTKIPHDAEKLLLDDDLHNIIAKMLMSSLPSEKVQELLRSFRTETTNERENHDAASQPSTSKVLTSEAEADEAPKIDEDVATKKATAKSRRNSNRKPSTASKAETTSPGERPSTRSSARNPSTPRATTPATRNVKKEKTNSRAASASSVKKPAPAKNAISSKSKNNSVAKTKQPQKISKKPVAAKTKFKGRSSTKKEKVISTVLKRHPFSQNHRPSLPRKRSKYTLVEAVPSRAPTASRLSSAASYCFGVPRLNVPSIPKEFAPFLRGPSNLTIRRYQGCLAKLADRLAHTHLNIPEVSRVRWQPSGSWKSPFEDGRKRKAATIATSEAPAKKVAKVDKRVAKKTEKLGPLKITIRRNSDESEVDKKKKISVVTPLPKDTSDYVKIRSNILTEIPPKLSLASKPCDCEESDPCTSTSGCLTRASSTECTQYSCQLYSACQNRRILNNESVHQLQLFKHSKMINGVRSTVDICKDQLVCEFVGEVIRKDTHLKRLENGQSYHHFGVELIPGSYVIDASKKGNLSRFMNHSCEPNCVMQRWVVNGQQRIGIFALKNIESGVELTYDYSMHVYQKHPTKCLCESPNCKGVIPSMRAPAKAPSKPEKLSKSEIQLVKTKNIFLQRNLRKYNTVRAIPLMSAVPSLPKLSAVIADIFNQFVRIYSAKLPRRWLQSFSISTRKIFDTAEANPVAFVERFDANVKCCLSMISKSMERREADALQHQYLQLKRHSDISEVLKDKHSDALLAFLAERPRNRKNDHSPRVLSATTDFSYMDSKTPVGSYDPDKESLLFSQPCSPDGDSIRCVCGIMDEGGEMYQCDQCHYWLHRDCLGLNKEPDEYVCPFCEKSLKSTPLLDILLTPQPEYRIDSCVYYKTLVNCREIQIRVNECVYVERVINDEYKRRLKKFHEECVDGKTKAKKRKTSTTTKLPPNVEEPPASIFKPEARRLYDRKDLRTFRIERLFKVPTGERFAFGCYYARPHETFVDPGRMFYKNELFWTPLFDTLPLDVIVGRCLCLEPQEFAAGRPKGPQYHDDDVFVCEYSIDKTQKVFEKINLKNRYHINTAEYLFDRFEKPLSLKRNFTPFVIKTDKKTNEKAPKNKLQFVVKQTGSLRLHQYTDKLTSKP